MAIIYCKSDAVILHFLQNLPHFASLTERESSMLPIYFALSYGRSLSIVIALLICSPLIGKFDQTLCNGRVETDSRIAITKPLSFWNAFARKFEEGDSLKNMTEEVKLLLKGKSESTDNEVMDENMFKSRTKSERVNSKLMEDIKNMKEKQLEENKRLNSNYIKIVEEIKEMKEHLYATNTSEQVSLLRSELQSMKKDILTANTCVQSKIDNYVYRHEISNKRIKTTVAADLMELKTELESKLQAVEIGISRCFEQFLDEYPLSFDHNAEKL